VRCRAFTYALPSRQRFDLAEITLDENWRIWAGDLATTRGRAVRQCDGRLLEAVSRHRR
jgi:hypothetical protein